MFESLASAVDSLEVSADAAELRALLALRARLDANLARRTQLVDAAKGWEVDQAVSMTGWLKAEAGQSARTASLTARTAKRTAQLPVTTAAWATGELSTGQVELLATRIPTRLVPAFAEAEAQVVPALVGLTVADTGHVINRWVQLADQDGTEPPPERTSELYASEVAGAVALNGNLRGEAAHTVLRALNTAIGTFNADDPRTPARLAGVTCGS